MTIEANEFFHQATLRICSSLDINMVLYNTLDYLKKFMPSTGLGLVYGESGLPAIVIYALAQTTNSKTTKTKEYNLTLPLPQEVRASIERDWVDMKNVVLVNNPEADTAVRTMAHLTEMADISVMHMRLNISDKRLFGLVIYTAGRNQYKEEHAQLLSTLHDPFAIAMSNALKHDEILKLKEMLTDDNRYLHQELLRLTGDEIIGRDGGLKDVFKTIRQVAALDSPVLLLGETGVGKEAIANAIHYSSHRRNGPFIKVNCGAIPETLIDSELFGHEKGAFTGALAQKRGRFERAHKGTILLDEIGELSSTAQVRLLRVLQNKEIERVGGAMPIPVDIRIIAATHRDLKSMINSNRFREDLWFRLNVLPITIPPLRNRKEDIPALVSYFIKRKSLAKNIPPPGIDQDSIRLLKEYIWPGNVRELENVVERALIQYQGQNMTGPMAIDDLFIKKTEHDPPKSSISEYEYSDIDRIISMHVKQTLRHALENIALLQSEYETLSPPGKKHDAARVDDIIAMQLSLLFKQPVGKMLLSGKDSQKHALPPGDTEVLELDKVNSLHIQKVLKMSNGKIHGSGGAAELLGLNPSTLRNRMKKLDILHSKNNSGKNSG